MTWATEIDARPVSVDERATPQPTTQLDMFVHELHWIVENGLEAEAAASTARVDRAPRTRTPERARVERGEDQLSRAETTAGGKRP